jgi:predicted dehydrogenase
MTEPDAPPPRPTALPTDSPLTRRTFLARSAGAVAAAAVPASLAAASTAAASTAASWARVPGANARLRLGVIGAGGRGRYVMSIFQKQPELDVVALADPWDASLQQALARAPGARTAGDYRRVLDARDVDAVLIATPDHWHSRVAVDALHAGKDAYVEKPMAHSPEEGRQMVRAVRETKRVLQVGLQQRSGPHYLEAKREYFDTKRIGKVVHVRTYWHGNAARVVRPPFTEQPAGLDWKQWLGPAKMRPFDPKMVVNWRSYFDFGGGTLTDLFTHWIDVAHMFLGEDLPGSAVAAGGIFQYADGRDAPDTVDALLEYPGGWTASFAASLAPGASGAAVEFYGTEGTLYIDRQKYTFTPPGRDAQPVTVPFPGDQTEQHVANFLECVRSRGTPTSDVVSGYRSTLTTLLAKQAYMEKRRVTFDPARERAAVSE